MTENTAVISHTDSALPQRKVVFDFSRTPLHWLPGDAFSSHLISEIHLLLPEGEFWFCRLYNQALPLITDERLKADVRGFVRQEAVHGRAHANAISGFLEAHNIRTLENQKLMQWLFQNLLGDNPLGLKLPDFLKRLWLVFRLGIIASIEHFTCVLGKYIIEQKYFDGGDPVMVDMLRWHGAEEIEHRCVAFDLYQHLGGRYPMRFLMLALIAPVLIYLWVSGAASIMRQDPAFAGIKPSMWRPWLWRQWARVAREGKIPSIWWLVREAFRYLNPRYHPLHEASTQQALDYLRTSPAALAAAQK